MSDPIIVYKSYDSPIPSPYEEGTLRWAISEAEAGEGDTINFDPSLSGDTITLTSGQITISTSLTINGLGADNLTISGTYSSRVFKINNDSINIEVTINDISITNGFPPITDPDGDRGGAIYNSDRGTLYINNSTLSNNGATCSNDIPYGGAIYNSGTVAIENSTLSGNTANYGGAILNDGTVDIINSMLSYNRAYGTDPHVCAYIGGAILNNGTVDIINSMLSYNSADTGGAIYNRSSYTVAIENSTLSDNTCNSSGGAIYNRNSGTVNIKNSTLSGNGNTSSNYGGAIYNYSKLDISFSTIANNQATSGGGIYNVDGDIDFKNSIVADNTGSNYYKYPYGSGTITAVGVNYDTDGTCTGFTTVSPDYLKLGPLQDNGGPTQTCALLKGSVAIDAAPDCPDVSTDQRGVSRPQNSAWDVGAYEFKYEFTHKPSRGIVF